LSDIVVVVVIVVVIDVMWHCATRLFNFPSESSKTFMQFS